ncbi:type IV pilus biogenesis/stability protein PilW [Zobellella endophytica]|uniref:Type IV pilus biogenesis/stability protein PilW n=1 Tax=Zobellella endophytica TaxID=2116700 RepID=A0A2P7QQG6_9GAMM|nr:type IV pilus biogenesis/stability protein PilW [Zobellella endophytica]PSJ40199.1 type IV pilus biogenesis/stability protein PilW [Zobellella endophytica]
MRRLTLLPTVMILGVLSGCVSETTHWSGGKPSRDLVFKPSEAAMTRMNLGLEYLQRGDAEQAKFNIDRALSQDPRNPDIHLAQAYFYQSVSEFDNAEKSYRQVLKLAPNHGDGLNNYGVFLCSRERFDEADAMFRKAVVVPGYVQVADTYENAALCASRNGQPQAALDYFKRALEYNPAKPRSLLGAAELLVEQGDEAGALDYLARYQREHQANPQSLWLTVRTAETLGRVAQAQQAGAELVRLFPDSEQAKRFLANDY